MNILQRIKFLPVALILGTFIFTSCEETDITTVITGSKENLVYINTGFALGNYPKNTGVLSTSFSSVGITSSPIRTQKIPIQCSQPAAEDIQVVIDTDYDSMLEGWERFPNIDGIVKKMNFIIPKGATQSTDSVEIDFSYQVLTSIGRTGKFMLPLKISSVTGAKLFENLSKFAYCVNITYNNAASGTPANSLLLEKSPEVNAWTAIATGPNDEPIVLTDMPNMFNDIVSGRTNYTATGAVTDLLPFTIDIDMNQTYTNITGFRILYTARNMSITNVSVYGKKSESDEWVLQAPAFALTAGTTQNVLFRGPMEFRFIRLQVNTVNNQNNGLSIIDFNIYQLNI